MLRHARTCQDTSSVLWTVSGCWSSWSSWGSSEVLGNRKPRPKSFLNHSENHTTLVNAPAFLDTVGTRLVRSRPLQSSPSACVRAHGLLGSWRWQHTAASSQFRNHCPPPLGKTSKYVDGTGRLHRGCTAPCFTLFE